MSQDASFTMTRRLAAPCEMDALWAAGWRHFGEHFFRYPVAFDDDQAMLLVMPLRIDVARFAPSRIHRRVRKHNADVRVEFRPATIDAEKHRLFALHKQRFQRHVPDSLFDFVSDTPATKPCTTVECCLFQGARLFGVSFLDLGGAASSAVYALFDPAESRRSPGIFMILAEIDFVRRAGKRYLYTGYAYHTPAHYDYKKGFAATEWYDWHGNWRPLDRRDDQRGGVVTRWPAPAPDDAVGP